MAVTIQRVGNDKELKEFIRVPWKVYANDPNWVPWLYYERLEFFDKRKNAFFEHAEGDYFIARRDGEAVGAIAVFVNHRYNDFQQQNVAHFGAFEVMNDREAALALLGTAETWARERGLDSLLGPFTFSTNDETGTLIDGFGSPPVILMTYNQPYVPQFIEAAGFRKAMDLWAWIADLNKLEQEMPEKVRRVVGKVTERYDLHLRLVDLKDWDAEVARIKTIYNSAWERNWGFVPMTDAEIEHMGASLKAVLDPALERRIGGVEPADELQRLGKIAARHQHGRDDQLLDHIRIRAGRIEDRHAPPAEAAHRDVVRAGPRAADREHALGYGHRMHVGRAHQDRVGHLHVLPDLVEIRRQPFEAERRDLVEHQHPEGARHVVSPLVPLVVVGAPRP